MTLYIIFFLLVMSSCKAKDNTVPKGGGICETLEDCNWGGDCIHKQCNCDITWTGSHCESLHLLPAIKSAVYPPNANTPEQDIWTWGGAAIIGEDHKVHLFVTEWKNHCPMTYPSFITQTHIMHVIGDSADGPFEVVQEAVPGAAGNPVITRAADGTYLLYFTNYRYTGTVKNCSKLYNNHNSEVNNTACGIHLAYSRNLNGPWDIVYDIAYGPGNYWDNCTLTNPGPFIFPNSTVLMMFKLCRYPPNCPKGRYITGLLTSPLESSFEKPAYLMPYTRRPRPDPIINATPSNSIEDPSNGFIDRRGTIHMLVHVGTNRGSAIHSPNGINWHYNLTLRSYPNYIIYTDGSRLTLDQRQEPKLLLNADGLPTHLINICGTGGLSKTFVCFQPICSNTSDTVC